MRPRAKPPAPRGECSGWSPRTSRGNTRFLYSIVSADLPATADGELLLGISGSLTVRDCPASHEDWKRVRESFLTRLRRRGLYRLHWITEWQKRGVPHLHFAAWFPLPADSEYGGLTLSAQITADWLQLTSQWGSDFQGQEVKPITDEVGWLRYLSKHASRGGAHYQRSMALPEGWQKTGRMWGYLGDFPTLEPVGVELGHRAWYRFRRIVRGWRLAEARGRKVFYIRDEKRRHLEEWTRRRRIRAARRMLQCQDPALSRCRGVSEWIPFDLGVSISDFLAF